MKLRSILKSLYTRILLWVQGMLFGASFYVLSVIVSYSLHNVLLKWDERRKAEAFRLNPTAPREPCVPLLVDSLLTAVSWGPALSYRHRLSLREMQIISGLIFSGLGAIAFLLAGRKWGTVTFLTVYAVLMAALTFFFYMLAVTG
jgi:hypothetical protein